MRNLEITDLIGKRIEYFRHVERHGDLSFVADVQRVHDDHITVLGGDHNERKVYPDQIIGIVETIKIIKIKEDNNA